MRLNVGNYAVVALESNDNILFEIRRDRELGFNSEDNVVKYFSVLKKHLIIEAPVKLADSLFSLLKRTHYAKYKAGPIEESCVEFVVLIVKYLKEGKNLNDIEDVINKPSNYYFCIDEDIDMSDVDSAIKECYANRSITL